MNRTIRKSPLKLVVLVALLAGAGSVLKAQQVGHYIGGGSGLENGSTPPPGLYVTALGLIEPIDSIKGPNGNTALKPDLTIKGAIAGYTFVTPKKILGGDYGLSFLVTVLNTRFNSNLFDASAESAGLSDIFVEPILIGWEKGRANYTVNYGFWAPTGDFDPNLPLNPGLGFWEHQIEAGATVGIDKKKLWNASLLTTWEINHSKSGTDIKAGPIFTGEYSFGRRFFKYQMNAGVTGFISQKLSADTGSINPLIKGDLDRGFAIGPEWKYTDVKHHLAWDVRYEQPFGAELRASGTIIIFSITFLHFLPPPKK